MKVTTDNQKENKTEKSTMTNGIVDLLLNTLENSKSKEDKLLAKNELRKLAMTGLGES